MAFTYRLDLSRCIGCRACEVACVTANDLDPAHARNWVKFLEDENAATGEATFAPYLCSHCDDPPCVDACPTGASYKAEDGRVLVDKELCIGCGLCEPACPYEARYIEPQSQKMEKCTLCEGRVQNGQAPACFEVCPAGARTYIEIVDGEVVAQVGDVEAIDAGHDVMALTTAEINPGPSLTFSGEAAHLELLRTQRPPREDGSVAAMVWRNGIDKAVGGLGVASAVAMSAMIGMHALRDRKARVAAAEGKGE